MKASINKGLTPALTQSAEFSDIVPITRAIALYSIIRDGNWIAGFTTGEGCFMIRLDKGSNRRLGYRVQLTFKLTQHIRDEQLIRSLVN